MKKILVTGEYGFTGSNLCKKLIDLKYDLTVLNNFSIGCLQSIKNFKNKLKFNKIDIKNKKNIEKYFNNINTVFHIAILVGISFTKIKEIKKVLEYKQRIKIEIGTKKLLNHLNYWKKPLFGEQKKLK